MNLDRRTLLRTGAGLLGAAALTACGAGRTEKAAFVSPAGPQVRAAEQARRPGRVRDIRLVAAPAEGAAWAYNGQVPGPEIRVTAGEVVRARLVNNLPAETSIHWHGLALRNDADGVPGVTQQPVRPGAEHVYEFTAPDPGTHWFHPHSGTQFDRGLYAPIIVEDPREPLGYDAEWVVVLDDWLDGDPDEVLAELAGGMDHTKMSPNMLMGATSPLLGGDAGDVRYATYLINGKARQTFRAKPGTRLRIRLINAGGDTAFRVALGGHRLTVTHTDGFAVQPVETDALLIGMGERYDVLVTLKDGAFPLTALAEGKKAAVSAVVRTGSGTPGKAGGLDGRVLRYAQLLPHESVRLAARTPDRTVRFELTGGMAAYDWAINGRRYDPRDITPIRQGERVRLSFVNRTTMWHPMHLHGHTFALPSGARKDTAVVLPGDTLEVDFQADNPGVWMVHCHNVYHQESGMMTLLGYESGGSRSE
ncbi:multicopper oxidase family protein [Nonomuraea typhae]|uniref:Multicopper oxidase family protein n=1 Tax=Nonomuraea typhae TaxID=2603600 RepID=A0ABW7YLM2_9ACTN